MTSSADSTDNRGMPMGKELGAIHAQLSQEVAYLCRLWETYKELYIQGEERIELLNKSAGSFFAITQSVYIREIISQVHRLTDPVATLARASNKNLTFYLLPHLVDASIADALSQICEEIKIEKKKTLKIRHKKLAHLDLETALNRTKLSGGDQKDFEQIIALFTKALNVISAKYNNSCTDYRGVTFIGGAKSLVFKLKDAAYLEVLQKECRENKDWENPILRDPSEK